MWAVDEDSKRPGNGLCEPRSCVVGGLREMPVNLSSKLHNVALGINSLVGEHCVRLGLLRCDDRSHVPRHHGVASEPTADEITISVGDDCVEEMHGLIEHANRSGGLGGVAEAQFIEE